MPLPKLLLTHTDSDRGAQFPPETLTRLRQLADLILHNSPTSLTDDALILAAAGVQIIVSGHPISGGGRLFAASQALVAYICQPKDVYGLDVAAASAAGVLVVTATPEETASRLGDILRGVAPEGSVNTGSALRLRRFAPPLAPEVGGTEGPEPTRYGDWQHKGRVTDF
jgi:hypothetical protein